MGRMRNCWSFGKEHGFSGSAGETHVSGYKRGGSVKGGGHGTTPRGPMAHVKQSGPHKGSAPKPARPHRAPMASTTPHKFAHGGKVKGGATIEKPSAGGMLPYKKGGKVGFKPEDQEEHENQTGFQHNDVEKPYEHYEAKRGGRIHRKAHGGHVHDKTRHHGHVKAPQRGPIKSKAHRSHAMGGEATVEHSHFLPEHDIVSEPIGIHHDKHGHDDHKHHAPPHKTHGHKKYAMGGPTRPPGMPRSPMLGMKRMRHGPNQRQMPGIPGMAPVATGSLGMGQGTAPKVMKKGGKA